MKPQIKRAISQIIPFGIIFLVAGLLYAVLENGILGDFEYYPSNGLPYDFETSIYFSLALFLVGLIVGLVEVLFLKKRFRNKGFGQKIIYKTIFYLVLNYLLTLIVFPVGMSLNLNVSILDPIIWDRLLIFVISVNYLSFVVYSAVTLIISLFYAEINENIGSSVLSNFFTGKYQKPIEEERIFMFLDMKSSTAIAEQLGHVKYFAMLREYYADLSKSIVKYSGEIYQYVGDEIVITWSLEDGLENQNCLRCFYAMKRSLEEQADKYKSKYGLVPTFKAGFHSGKVTTGEIGVIKKDIIFTGDVLNTTARIQGLCNEFGVDNIISGELVNKLDFNAEVQVQSLGEKELRGRKENVLLYTVV